MRRWQSICLLAVLVVACADDAVQPTPVTPRQVTLEEFRQIGLRATANLFFGFEHFRLSLDAFQFGPPIVRTADTTTSVVGRSFVLPVAGAVFLPDPARNDAPADGVRFVLRDSGGTAVEYMDVRRVADPVGAPLHVSVVTNAVRGTFTVTGTVEPAEAQFACCVFEHMLVAPREMVAEGTINDLPFVYRDTASQSMTSGFHAFGSGHEYAAVIAEPGEQGRLTVRREAFRRPDHPSIGRRTFVRIAMPYDQDSAIVNYVWAGNIVLTIDIGDERVLTDNASPLFGGDTLTQNVYYSLYQHLFELHVRGGGDRAVGIDAPPRTFEVLMAPAIFAMRWRIRSSTSPPVNPALDVIAALEGATKALRLVSDSLYSDPGIASAARALVRTADTTTSIAGRTFIRVGNDSVFVPTTGTDAPPDGARFILGATPVTYVDIGNVVAPPSDTLHVDIRSAQMQAGYRVVGAVIDTVTEGGVPTQPCCGAFGFLAAPRVLEATGTVRSLDFMLADSADQDRGHNQKAFWRQLLSVRAPTGLVMLSDSVHGFSGTTDAHRRIGVMVSRAGRPAIDVHINAGSFFIDHHDISMVMVGTDTLRRDPYGLWSGSGYSVPRRMVEEYLEQTRRAFERLRAHTPSESMLAPALFAMRWRTRHM